MDQLDVPSTPQGMQVQTGPLGIERAPIQALNLGQSAGEILGPQRAKSKHFIGGARVVFE